MYKVELSIEEICLIKSALTDLNQKLQDKKVAAAHFYTGKKDLEKSLQHIDETRLDIFTVLGKLNNLNMKAEEV